ncbi:MAG: PDGLE domain-containing protein [Bacteroidales bacterium]
MEKKYWIFLVVLAVLSPLGIFLPNWFNAGDAWGEWSVDVVKQHVGYEPAKMKTTADVYSAPVPDYNFFDEDAPITRQVVAYIVSAFIGIGIILLLTFGLQKITKAKDDTPISSPTQ